MSSYSHKDTRNSSAESKALRFHIYYFTKSKLDGLGPEVISF